MNCTILTVYRLNEDRLVAVVGTRLICGVGIEVGITRYTRHCFTGQGRRSAPGPLVSH